MRHVLSFALILVASCAAAPASSPTTAPSITPDFPSRPFGDDPDYILLKVPRCPLIRIGVHPIIDGVPVMTDTLPGISWDCKGVIPRLRRQLQMLDSAWHGPPRGRIS